MADTHRGFILQPTYRIEAGRPVVHLYGRLEDGRTFLVRDQRALPHFYVAAADSERARALGARAAGGDGKANVRRPARRARRGRDTRGRAAAARHADPRRRPVLRGRRPLRDALPDRSRRARRGAAARRFTRGPGRGRRVRGPGCVAGRLGGASQRALLRHRDRPARAPSAVHRARRLRRLGGAPAHAAGLELS